jgi:hypothetical protein
LADIFALGLVENVAHVRAGVAARFHKADEILDELLEEYVVFPECVVGVDQECVASHEKGLARLRRERRSV